MLTSPHVVGEGSPLPHAKAIVLTVATQSHLFVGEGLALPKKAKTKFELPKNVRRTMREGKTPPLQSNGNFRKTTKLCTLYTPKLSGKEKSNTTLQGKSETFILPLIVGEGSPLPLEFATIYTFNALSRRNFIR